MIFRATVIAAVAIAGAAAADTAAKPIDRAEAARIVAQARHIVTPNGIERLAATM
jgi:hypothetical protein